MMRNALLPASSNFRMREFKVSLSAAAKTEMPGLMFESAVP